MSLQGRPLRCVPTFTLVQRRLGLLVAFETPAEAKRNARRPNGSSKLGKLCFASGGLVLRHMLTRDSCVVSQTSECPS